MAIMPQKTLFPNYSPDYSPNEFQFDYEEWVIGGKLVAASHTLGIEEAAHFKTDEVFRDELKKRLISSLVEHMIRNKLVEVTFKNDPIMSTITIKARAYIAPDEQVKILRRAKYNGR